MTARQELEEWGRVWRRGLLSTNAIHDLAALTDAGGRPGGRLDLTPELSLILGPNSRLGSAARALGFDTHPVRLVAFNKTSEANWSVPWHQDRVIAVAEKRDVPGYDKWVRKLNYWHCEAPPSLLANMMFARVHIDHNTAENGALELALRSQTRGRISATDARAIASDCEIEVCRAASGDVLFVHALTLHRSRSATVSDTRRTVRVDYAERGRLHPQLQWAIGA